VVPPTNRRPGFSRKAQYSLFATYVMAVAGTALAALLLILSFVDRAGFSALRTVGTEVTSPVSRLFASISRTVTDAATNTSAYLDAGSKNAALQKQVDADSNKIIEAQAIKLENNRLRQLLELKQTEPEYIAIGNLISSSSSSSRRLATLSIGSTDGVERGQPVRGPSGLIGRIIETGPTTARVLLITDANSPVPVMRAADGTPASGEGLSNGMVSIRPVNLGINPFKKGDIVVTSGNGGLFRPNIPFAIVVKATRDGALARPLADPASSPYVMVLPIYEAAATAVQAMPEPGPGNTEPLP
jgi:rod shape-determining protein MreC